MNRVVLIASLLVVLVAGCEKEQRREINPTALDFSGELPNGVRLMAGDGASTPDYLVIENANPAAQTFRVASIESPGITNPSYAIMGEVRYAGVSGNAYFMMDNYFPDGGPYSSKGVDSRGVGRVTGNSDWRSFSLPFFRVGEDGLDTGKRPTKIELLMVMPSSGTVYLRNVRLWQPAPGSSPPMARRGLSSLGSPGQWWTGSQAGLIFGGLGGLIGCLGGLIGTLASMGRGRRFVIASMIGMFVVGVASLVLGVVALGCSQPYSVYYPPFSMAVVLIPVSAALLPSIRRRYAEVELRKMNAGDVG